MHQIKFERPKFVRHTRPKIAVLGALNLQNALKQTLPMPCKILARKYIGGGNYEIVWAVQLPNGFFTANCLAVVHASFPNEPADSYGIEKPGKLCVRLTEIEPSEQWRKQTRCFFGATK